MPAPTYLPEVDTNGIRQPSDPAGIPQAIKDGGLREKEGVPNTWWNWIFKTIHDWIVWGTALFGVEHNTTTGAHTDINADSAQIAGELVVEKDNWGSGPGLRVGGVVDSATADAFDGTDGDFTLFTTTVPANYIRSSGSVIRQRGGYSTLALNTGTAMKLSFKINGSLVAVFDETGYSATDGMWGGIEYVFNPTGTHLHFVATGNYHNSLYLSGDQASATLMGTVAFDETVPNTFEVTGQLIGGDASDTAESRVCYTEIHRR